MVTGTIKIMHRLLAVAARLLALVESLALRHHDVHTVRRVIRLNPSRSMVSAPLAHIHPIDPVLVPSGPNPLVMLVRHLLHLGVTVCQQDLFFVAIISMASTSWPDLCGDHRTPASRDRWLSSPSLPCCAHLCLAVKLCSFRSFLIVLAILCVRSSAPCCPVSPGPQETAQTTRLFLTSSIPPGDCPRSDVYRLQSSTSRSARSGTRHHSSRTYATRPVPSWPKQPNLSTRWTTCEQSHQMHC